MTEEYLDSINKLLGEQLEVLMRIEKHLAKEEIPPPQIPSTPYPVTNPITPEYIMDKVRWKQLSALELDMLRGHFPEFEIIAFQMAPGTSTLDTGAYTVTQVTKRQ